MVYREPESLGFRLKVLIHINGLSIAETGRRAGINPAHMNRLVNGSVGLTAKKAIPLAKVLHWTPYKLMNTQIKRQLWEAKHGISD